MGARSSSLGYYGFLALTLGIVLLLVGMRPPQRATSAPTEPATPVATMMGRGLVLGGSVAIAAYAWMHERERRRSSQALALGAAPAASSPDTAHDQKG